MYSLTAQHKDEMPIYYSARYKFDFQAHELMFNIIGGYSYSLRRETTTINWSLGDDSHTGYIKVYFGDPDEEHTYWIQFTINEVED